MAAKSTWSGSITFAGFPIHVRVFTLVTSRKSASFKMLDPIHKQPVSQVLIDCKGDRVERAATLRGVQSAPDHYAVLPPAALEMIENVGRSVTVEVERFAPVATVQLELSLESYRIFPDEKVPGSEQPVMILWNGLRKSQRAAVIENWCPRAGARPSTLVIHATDDGLHGNLLPFAGEIKSDLPVFAVAENEQAAAMFAAVLEQQYSTADFDLAAYTNGYAERRQAAIDLALSGTPIPAAVADAPAPAAAPDMMAMLAASLAATGTPVVPKAKKAPAKAKAKVAA